jgi:hypothetical protein
MTPDIAKFLPVAIFKMAATIPHKFNIVQFQRPELIPDIEKFLPVSIFKMAATIQQDSATDGQDNNIHELSFKSARIIKSKNNINKI